MRDQLVVADIDDNGEDLAKSEQIAWGINEQHRKLISKSEVDDEKAKMATEKDLDEDQIDSKKHENVEYHSMIRILDAELKKIQAEMGQIERDNGIFNKTRDTWMAKEDQEEKQKFNILDVFQVEIEN